MTKNQLTRERLEKIKLWRETYGAGSNVMLPAVEAEELARMALAAMDRYQVRNEHAEWSQSTFGNGGPIGPLKHLSKEALEPLNSLATCRNGLICSSYCGMRSVVQASLMSRLPKDDRKAGGKQATRMAGAERR